MSLGLGDIGGHSVPPGSLPLVSVLSQEGHETQCPAEVPLPEGHLRDHPEDAAAVPGLPPAQVPGKRHEEGE